MSADVSIIIVNWNSVEHLRKCLASIASDPYCPQLEIIVVDNASFDGSATLVHDHHPEVMFIQSRENLGFAQANNLGTRYASAQTLLFLNPDTEVRPGALQRMLAQLWSRPEAGAAGARLLNSDATLQTTCLQAFPTVWNQFIDTDYLKRVFPRWRVWGMRPLFSPQPVSDDVEMISGACLMVRREVFEQVGCFGSDYFIYGEDVDLCFKIKQSGAILRYVGDAEVVHHGGQSTKSRSESGFSDVMTRQSVYYFLQKTRGPLYARACRSAVFVSAGVRLLILELLRALAWDSDRREALRRTRAKWKLILRWSIGLEPWTNGYRPAVAAPVANAEKRNVASTQ